MSLIEVYKIKNRIIESIVLIILFLIHNVQNQLLINIQNQGGEVIQESITSNITEEIIILEFQKTDGTLITQLIDLKNEIKILKALILGEEERGQSQYQVMCFVTKFLKTDFISIDAMIKLRQKNPNTIRTPEDDRGKEIFTMTGWVNLNKSFPITKHLNELCSEALDSTYIQDINLKNWNDIKGTGSLSNLDGIINPFPIITKSLNRCNEISNIWVQCKCNLEICIGWYPCGLKYCKNGKLNQSTNMNGVQNHLLNYRCGIKTCRKCSQFLYYVQQKQECLWDE